MSLRSKMCQSKQEKILNKKLKFDDDLDLEHIQKLLENVEHGQNQYLQAKERTLQNFRIFLWLRINYKHSSDNKYFGIEKGLIDFVDLSLPSCLNGLQIIEYFVWVTSITQNYYQTFVLYVKKWDSQQIRTKIPPFKLSNEIKQIVICHRIDQCQDFLTTLFQIFFSFTYNFFMNSEAKRLRSKLGWQSDEQKLIDDLVASQGMSWKEISGIINQKFPERKRNPKQCRQRYNNYIKFQKNKRNTQSWESTEEEKLLQLYMKFGSRWTEISNELHDRSPNEVKNKFYGTIRRLVRRINEILRGKQIKTCKKPISYQTLLRLLSTEIHMLNSDSTQMCSKLIYIKNLKEKVLEIASNTSNLIEYGQAQLLSDELIQYNIMTRADRLREMKTSKKDKKQRIKAKFSDMSQQAERSIKICESSTGANIETTNKQEERKDKEIDYEEFQYSLFQCRNQPNLCDLDAELNQILGISNQIKNEVIDYL